MFFLPIVEISANDHLWYNAVPENFEKKIKRDIIDSRRNSLVERALGSLRNNREMVY